jgi:hypothetical protein
LIIGIGLAAAEASLKLDAAALSGHIGYDEG